MKEYPDMIGKRFGMWTVLGPSERPYHLRCRCDCGRECDVNASSLRLGKSTCCRHHAPVNISPDAQQARERRMLESNQSAIGETINGFLIKGIHIKHAYGRNHVFCIATCPVCGCDTETLLSRIRRGMTRCATCNRDLKKKIDVISAAYNVDGTRLPSLQSRLNGTVNKNSRTGVNGISLMPDGRYRAYIYFRRKHYHLGVYSNIEDAIAARKKGEELYQSVLEENDGWESRYAELMESLKK